ncbi:MAG TPA: DNA-binding protein [Deltaproteobacteria bacterium]|nr:DNA-binding protein [Deltaproteobacteria bacterium]
MKHQNLQNAQRLDANEQIFFARELESIKAKTYDIRYPALKCRELIPVSFEAGSGAKSITYRQYDQMGMAKIIANPGADLPRADIAGKEFTSPVHPLGDSYGWSLFDIRAAIRAGVPLQQRKANAAKRAMLQAENEIAFFGDSEYGLPGLFNNPNIPSDSVPNDGAGSLTTFASKTADQILRDMNKCVSDVFTNTNGVEMANTLIMPPAQYALIKAKRVPDLSTTVLKHFLETNPGVSVEWCNEAKGAGPIGVDIMMAYDRNPDKLTLEIPTDFEQLPVEARGIEFIVNCIQTIGGVIIYYPLAFNIAEGI